MNSTVNANTQIRKSVIAELNWDVAINAGQICVEVLDGVVTLSGQVGSYAEKWDAERAVQRVSRVNPRTVDVEDDQAESDPPSHTDLARSADGVLKWMTGLPMNSVKVVVKDGSISLSGELDRDNPRPTIDHTEVPLPTIQLDTDDTPTSAARLEAPGATAGSTVGLAAATLAAPTIERVNDSACCGGRVLKVVNNITVNC